jgi:signal transduction histidine kinase
MLKEDETIGTIAIYRQEIRPFTDKQIALLQNFAAQAVIAIENARLLAELRESLEQQTATAEVLKVISSSPGELHSVFEAMLDNATRICDASCGNLFRFDGTAFIPVAQVGLPPEYAEFLRQRGPFEPLPGGHLHRVMRTKQVSHTADDAAEPVPTSSARLADARSTVCIPMLKDNVLVGAFFIYRTEVRPFTDKQIALLRNFAAQAVIAIENARLLGELRQRTDDLSESLEQQTATSEVLQVISSSPGELEPVFNAMLQNAARICEARIATIMLREGNTAVVCAQSVPAEGTPIGNRTPLDRGWVTGHAMLEARTIHLADMLDTDAYPGSIERGRRHGLTGAIVAVPLIREEAAIGAIVVRRQEARPFTEKQIELVTNFASQAVIALENVRLFSELRARTEELARSVEELRALGEVSQAVNSTLDVDMVLTTIIAKAVELSGTEAGTIYTFDEARQEICSRASHGMDEALAAAMRDRAFAVGKTAVGKAVTQRAPIQIPDVQKESSLVFDIIQRAGYRAILIVPMRRPNQIVGVLVVRRKQPGEFPASTVELLETFADQSVLAIQNARLFREIEEKGRELEMASRHKSQFLANMSHELRTPLNAILGYTELIGDGIYGQPPEKMLGVLKRLESNGKHLLGLINDVLDLSKIEAGELKLSLTDYSITDMVATVLTSVEPLAAAKKLALRSELPADLPPARGDERRIAQVLLNLVGNAIKFTDAGEVSVRATAGNGSYTIAVRDTGPGISEADQAKLFQEFHQVDNSITRKKGGTGLGLAISKRIIEMHGGRIWLESSPGNGSTFSFTVPTKVEQQVGPS